MCSDRPTGWLVTGDRIVVKWDLYQAVGIKNGLILQHQTPLEKSEFCEFVIWGELSELHMTTVGTDYLSLVLSCKFGRRKTLSFSSLCERNPCECVQVCSSRGVEAPRGRDE